MMYPGAFEELYEGLKGLYEATMDEQIAMNEEFMKTRKPLEGLEMARYYRLAGASDILRTVLSIMSDAIHLENVKDAEVN